MNSLLLASEMEGESSLSDLLADAVKLTQDTNTAELGNQANVQISLVRSCDESSLFGSVFFH
jgi:hypothetical protein